MFISLSHSRVINEMWLLSMRTSTCQGSTALQELFAVGKRLGVPTGYVEEKFHWIDPLGERESLVVRYDSVSRQGPQHFLLCALELCSHVRHAEPTCGTETGRYYCYPSTSCSSCLFCVLRMHSPELVTDQALELFRPFMSYHFDYKYLLPTHFPKVSSKRLYVLTSELIDKMPCRYDWDSHYFASYESATFRETLTNYHSQLPDVIPRLNNELFSANTDLSVAFLHGVVSFPAPASPRHTRREPYCWDCGKLTSGIWLRIVTAGRLRNLVPQTGFISWHGSRRTTKSMLISRLSHQTISTYNLALCDLQQSWLPKSQDPFVWPIFQQQPT